MEGKKKRVQLRPLRSTIIPVHSVIRQTMKFQVRPADSADLRAILEIYNEAVANTTASYDYEPRSMDRQAGWFDEHMAAGLPVFVAVDDAGTVLGWGSLSRFHDRKGFRFTVENSLYVRPSAQKQGIGGRLLAAIVVAAQELKLVAVIAAVDAENAASIRLHEKHGFEQVGHFKKVGYKFDRWLDVVYLEKLV
jgi:L-amino acid N-acyltransferase